jgi:hypothetical protein
VKAGSDGFAAARIDQHVSPGRIAAPPIRRGTGLHVPSLLGNREAEPWELDVRKRAYQRLRDQVTEQLDIKPWTTP